MRTILDRHEAGPDPLSLARELVSTPSVNPVLDAASPGEEAIARLAAGWLEDWGLDVTLDEAAPGRPNVVARLSGSGATLLLNGHLDTVGTAGMTVDPFAGHVAEGCLWGRGACDMKGGLAALLSAAERLARGSGPRPDLVVALTADEEHAGLGMQRLVASGVRADMAVVCEPTGLAVMPAHKGFVWAEIIFHGRAAHGSRPEEGVDAIRHAALFLAALDELARRLASGARHPLLGSGSLHAGTIQGGTADSVYPERCVVTLERRTLPGEGGQDVMEELSAVLADLRGREPELNAELRMTLERSGTEVPVDSPPVEALCAAAAEEAPGMGAVAGMSAWVDAAFLNEAGIPAVCFGPGDIARAHSADECCSVAEIRACAKILERFARRLAS
ncbi:MAG: ArgE/DapE family deacylase [Gemmatimonadota bacterium]